MLRGSSLLLRRRADVLLKAAAALAVEERPKALRHMRHALQSLDEEGPVTETAAHGVARCRGLHARADALQLLVELLSTDTSAADTQKLAAHTSAAARAEAAAAAQTRSEGLAQATALADDLASSLSTELALLQAAPQKAGGGGAEQLRSLRKRSAQCSQLLLLLGNEQLEPAKAAARQLLSTLRADAAKVLAFATQGVHVHGEIGGLMTIASADEALSQAVFAPMWSRARALLVAAEKVGQVVYLIKDGRRSSLQEGVHLLVSLQEEDMPPLFTVCREIMRATDDEARASPAPGGEGRVVWWHRLEDFADDDDDEHEGVEEIEKWVASRHLADARRLLLKGQLKEGTAALEKLRNDLLMYFRDATP